MHRNVRIDRKEKDVLQYIKVRYSLPEGDQLSVTASAFIEGTCYRKLLVSSDSPRKVFSMYLSPDQRFLAPSLLDMTVDPDAEQSRIAARNKGLLSGGRSPIAHFGR